MFGPISKTAAECHYKSEDKLIGMWLSSAPVLQRETLRVGLSIWNPCIGYLFITCCCCCGRCCGRSRCCYCLLLLLLLWLLLFANKESFHSTPSFHHPLMGVIVKSAFLALSAWRERWFFSVKPVCVVIRFIAHPLPGNVVGCCPQSNVKWFAFTKVCCIDEII